MSSIAKNAVARAAVFAFGIATSHLIALPGQAATFSADFIDNVAAGTALPTYNPLADGETEVLSRVVKRTASDPDEGPYSPVAENVDPSLQPRALSNKLSKPENATEDAVPLSRLAVHMFQLLASHEIAKTPTGGDPIDIPLEPGDEQYFGNGDPLEMTRSLTTEGNPNEQLNEVTSMFDGSTVYGSTEERKKMLWETVDGQPDGQPTGYLLTSKTDGYAEPGEPTGDEPGGLPKLPVQMGQVVMYRAAAGDVRADENPTLEALHQLFVLEHNRIAELIWEDCTAKGADCSGEEVFNAARYLVAETQKKIFYEELLPLFLGTEDFESVLPNAPETYAVAGAINEFTAAAGRIGHTQVPETIVLANREDGVTGEVKLSDCFFDRGCLGQATLEDILYGASLQQAEPVDLMVADSLRNGLTPGFGAMRKVDLIATNINRGRDHALPGYFELREALGFGALTSWEQIEELLPASVLAAYGFSALTPLADIQIDLMVGLFAEKRGLTDYLGETGKALWALQFLTLQDAGSDFILAQATGEYSFPVATSLLSADHFLSGQTMANLLANNLGGWATNFSNPFTAPVPLPPASLVLLGAIGCLIPLRRRMARQKA